MRGYQQDGNGRGRGRRGNLKQASFSHLVMLSVLLCYPYCTATLVFRVKIQVLSLSADVSSTPPAVLRVQINNVSYGPFFLLPVQVAAPSQPHWRQGQSCRFLCLLTWA